MDDLLFQNFSAAKGRIQDPFALLICMEDGSDRQSGYNRDVSLVKQLLIKADQQRLKLINVRKFSKLIASTLVGQPICCRLPKWRGGGGDWFQLLARGYFN